MYSPLNIKSGKLQTGAANIAGVSAQFPVDQTADGLEVTSGFTLPGTAVITTRLFEWLRDLRLLRNVPLCYMVADNALLPAESIRFFNVDPTWVDRIIDGVFSAANTGAVDIAYSVGMLELVRQTLDGALTDWAKLQLPGTAWTPDQGMTGMLIRSDLVRRWPDVMVRAYSGPAEDPAKLMPVLRAEALSKDIYIALFAGTPQLVQLREPHVGVRFGLETLDQKKFSFVPRDANAVQVNTAPTGMPLDINGFVDVPIDATWRTFPVRKYCGADARTVALQLMRPPYVQQFISNVGEPRGSEDPPPSVTFSNGRVLNVAQLKTRLATLERLGKS